MLSFNWIDIFKAARLAFSIRKIRIFLLGIVSAYVIYQPLVYLSLCIWNWDLSSKVWQSYGLLPVSPFLSSSSNLPTPTLVTIILGAAFAFIIFLLANLTVSKMAYEQLKGDDFYPTKEAFKFAKNQLKNAISSSGFLAGLFIFCASFPLFVALIGRIGRGVGAFILMIASSPLIMIPAFFLGLFMAFLVVVSLFGFFLIPAIVATTAEDAFETVYQLFSTIWNQPWRSIFYEALLFLSKIFWVSILALISFIGFQLILFPASIMIEGYRNIIDGASSFTGSEGVINRLAKWISDRWQFDILNVLAGNSTFHGSFGSFGSLSWSLNLSALFVSISSIFVLAFLISYLFSFGSVGNVIIYLLIRNKITGENLLIKQSAVSYQPSAKNSTKS